MYVQLHLITFLFHNPVCAFCARLVHDFIAFRQIKRFHTVKPLASYASCEDYASFPLAVNTTILR